MANTTTSSATTSTSAKSVSDKASEAAEKASKTVKRTTKNLANDAEGAAKEGLNRVKDAIPSMEGIAETAQDYVQDHTNVDLQKMADDAAGFVRRNPATSLAAAAGLGILIGVAMTKRY